MRPFLAPEPSFTVTAVAAEQKLAVLTGRYNYARNPVTSAREESERAPRSRRSAEVNALHHCALVPLTTQSTSRLSGFRQRKRFAHSGSGRSYGCAAPDRRWHAI